MYDLRLVPYHPLSEKLVDILCKKTQNDNPQFFRIMVAYYFAKLASMQRTVINTHDRGEIPVNIYALNLAPSGYGKGPATTIIEEHVINQFRRRFLSETFPQLAERNCLALAKERAALRGSDPQKELEQLAKDFQSQGPLLFSFDSGTVPAIKQMRTKLLLAGAGSMNLEIDEIGSNLLGQTEVLNAFLELYDVGKIKSKLIKNTSESQRTEELEGRTPANMMLYGTPAKLIDGGRTEEELWSFMDTGYGRRCIYGYAERPNKPKHISREEAYRLLTDTSVDTGLEAISDQFTILADASQFGRVLEMSEEVAMLSIEYRMRCEHLAADMPEHEDIRKSEMSHRYFKALKLAGAYAFVDETPEITEDQLYAAIRLVEDSGEAITRLISRDRPYMKLAKYMAKVGHEVTHADMMSDLPFFKGSMSQRNEMIQLATAWGYKHNIVIKRQYCDGIEFISGESLKETNLNELRVAWSKDIAVGYKNDIAPWHQLDRLVRGHGFHWVNHHTKDGDTGAGHRIEEKMLPGFNLIVLDVDKGMTIEQAQLLLKDYQAMFYTTKRHTPTEHRFRVILPTNYTLELNQEEYAECIQSIFDWLPFEVDAGTNQRARKWLANPNAMVIYQEGKLFDVLPFIPKTSKNEERKKQSLDQNSMTNIERWFINNTGLGNRSNQLIKYALLLVDQGLPVNELEQVLLLFNDKLADPLPHQEIKATIMRSVHKAIAAKNGNSAP